MRKEFSKINLLLLLLLLLLLFGLKKKELYEWSETQKG